MNSIDVLRKAKFEVKWGARKAKDNIEDLLLEFHSIEGEGRLAKFTVFPLELHMHNEIGGAWR